jgi:hypothetical protein
MAHRCHGCTAVERSCGVSRGFGVHWRNPDRCPVYQQYFILPERQGSSNKQNSNVIVDFILPPYSNTTLGDRHELRAFATGNPDLPFTMAQYLTVRDAWSKQNDIINNAGEMISSTNEEGIKVSVGYAQLSTSLVDWMLVFEQSYGEVIGPINRFCDIVLACVFSVFVAIIPVSFPLVHCAARPIRALRVATIEPYDKAVKSDSLDFSD